MLITVLALVLVVFSSIVVLAAWASSQAVLSASSSFPLTLRLVSATKETVTLPLKKETAYEGFYGLNWQNESAVLGPVLARSSRTVTRRIIKATGPLEPGQRVHWDIYVYRGDPQSVWGLNYEMVPLQGELGTLPAWFLLGPRSTWILLVHGLSATREESLRILPVLSRMGFPLLGLSFRNDRSGPPTADRLSHLGDTEWRDIEPGVRFALEHGAQSLVLYGWSMGGCVVETFLRRSSYVPQVRAVILDSPVLDWRGAISAIVRHNHLSPGLANLVERLVEWRAGIDLEALTYVPPAPGRTTPTLLFHGDADGAVPVESSDAFAKARPDLITYCRVHGADHIQSWNVGPQAYEDAVKTFLSRPSLNLS